MAGGGLVEKILLKSIERFATIDAKNVKVSTVLKERLAAGRFKDSDWVASVLRNTEDEGDLAIETP